MDKITSRIVNAYNAYRHDFQCANDNWNKANGRPTVAQHAVLEYIRHKVFGVMGGRLTLKHVNTYLDVASKEIAEIVARRS